jgi:hypothetical protein
VQHNATGDTTLLYCSSATVGDPSWKPVAPARYRRLQVPCWPGGGAGAKGDGRPGASVPGRRSNIARAPTAPLYLSPELLHSFRARPALPRPAPPLPACQRHPHAFFTTPHHPGYFIHLSLSRSRAFSSSPASQSTLHAPLAFVPSDRVYVRGSDAAVAVPFLLQLAY